MPELGFVLVCLGALVLLISALGLFRLNDALTRQHAATKSATFGQGLLLVGVAIAEGDLAWWWRVGLILAVLVITLPVAAQMLARAALASTPPSKHPARIAEPEDR